MCIVQPVLNGHSKIDNTKGLKPCGNLIYVKMSIEVQNDPWEHSAVFVTCIKRVSALKTYFCLLLSGRSRKVLPHVSY